MIYNRRWQITSSKGIMRFGCVSFVIGLILLGMAFVSYNDEEAFAKTAKYTTGTVVDFIENINNHSNVNNVSNNVSSNNTNTVNTSYSPVVSFQVNGYDYKFVSSSGSNPPEYQTGQSVEVMYDPQNPFNADINSWSDKWFGVIIFIILGIVFTALGALLITFRNKIKFQNLKNANPTGS